MKGYKAIIFDLDGTLLDTLADLADAVNYALAKNDLPTRTQEEVRAFIGNGIANLMRRAIGKEHSGFDAILNDFIEYYKAHCADKTQPYAGIEAMLKALKERNVKTGILSNKADFATKALAKQYFAGLLCAAAGENEAAGIRKKPAPDALLAMMKDFEVSKEETLYVGDSEVDIQTAQNAGVDCLLVAWGFKDESFLREHGAKRIIYQPCDLLKVIGF
ncbi:MAG: HAD-IA family hydrolase [Clostridia bacterium]|nr:HAD-IA family hydrolase [Clostridia bacterium]